MAVILVVDDEVGIRLMVGSILEDAGHSCIYAEDGARALEVFAQERPDLIVLDVLIPEINGYDIVKRLRSNNETIPIILLSAKGDIVDKSTGFQLGADDYLVKPFLAQELVLRVEALLRRGRSILRSARPDIIQYAGVKIDAVKRKVWVKGDLVELTPKEFHLLYMLACEPGKVFTRDQLVEDMWGENNQREITGITVLIHRLRSKIEENPAMPKYVQTVWHVGYRFGD